MGFQRGNPTLAGVWGQSPRIKLPSLLSERRDKKLTGSMLKLLKTMFKTNISSLFNIYFFVLQSRKAMFFTIMMWNPQSFQQYVNLGVEFKLIF